MLKAHHLLMKMDQCYSFTDKHTAQPVSCVVPLHLQAVARIRPWHLETRVSGGERGRDKGREKKMGD